MFTPDDVLGAGRVSRGLVALTVRVLSTAQRLRYREEFRSELIQLR